MYLKVLHYTYYYTVQVQAVGEGAVGVVFENRTCSIAIGVFEIP